MGRIHVCPLAHLGPVLRSSGAASVVSLLSPDVERPALPAAITRQLHLTVSDISSPLSGHVLAGAAEMDRLLAFFRAWNRRAPLIVHCHAGVSRSTAAAFVALCALDPDRPETVHAACLRQASPTATPNPRLVALADAALGRDGRMVAAVAAIGRGAECFEGNVFALDLPLAGAPPAEMG